MVCKENVVSWFGNLSSYKRIDVMCTLLNMCLPLEVRYLGTCVEDLGKRDYNFLRDTEHRANNVSDLTELSTLDITDKRTRRKLVLYMALLHSCNYTCAVILYENLSNFDLKEIDNLCNGTSVVRSSDDQPLEELLLLYTMALNHPAFNYEQKSKIGNIFLKLQEEETRLNIPKSGTSGMNLNDRAETDMTNCVVAPPPMNAYQVLPDYQGDMQMRGNAMIAGMHPGAMTLPPPGLCMPTPEQMQAMQQAGHQPQYVHLGFPAMGPMTPWTGQVMMAPNQILYQPTGELIGPYPNSPLVSRQSSPIQSQSQSRSSSPTTQMQRKVNGPSMQQLQTPRTSSQATQPTANTVTTSISTSSSQTNISNSTAPGTNTNPTLPSISSSRGPHLPSLLPSRPLAPYNGRHNSEPSAPTTAATTSTSTMGPPVSAKPQQAPPRLKPALASESGSKEMPNFKGNFQNNEIRRLSEEDVSKVDMTSNGLNSMKAQANGMNPEKKIDSPNSIHPMNDQSENEVMQMENDNSNGKPVTIPEQNIMNYHPQNHTSMTNLRRYPQPLEPGLHIPMYPAPAHIYPHNACYSCQLTAVPMTAMQNRFSRNNAPVYCLAQLQALRLEPDNRHCSQGSSSDSSGSRSPPETPPAIHWQESGNVPASSEQQHVTPVHSIPSSQPGTSGAPTERPRPRKSQSAHMSSRQHKSTQMMNGGTGTTQPAAQPPPNSSNMNYGPGGPTAPAPAPGYMPHATHFPALRPSTGIYTSFTTAYAPRPVPTAYPASISFQPNGDMMYQYPPATGNPPPPGNAVSSNTSQTGSSGSSVQSSPGQQQQQAYAQSAPVVFTTMPPPPHTQRQMQRNSPPPQTQRQQQRASPPPPKISCYNCGSLSHTAADCKDQTMEDITRGVQYRLDYSSAVPQQSGVEQNQSSDK